MESQISREQYLAVFQKHSENQNTVSLDKVSSILSEFGKDPEEPHFKKIFSDKHFITGQVDFDTFYGHIKDLDAGKNPKIVLGKMKINLGATKLLKIIESSVQDNTGLGVGGNPQEKNRVLDWNIEVGQNYDNTRLEFEARMGNKKDKILNELSFAELQNDQTYIILNFKSNDSAQAVQEIKDIIEQILALAEGLLPPQISQFISSIQFDYYNPDPSNLYVRISSNHELVELANLQTQQVASMFNPDVAVDFIAQTRLSLESLIANQEQESLAYLQQHSALNLHLHAEAGHEMLSKAKDLILSQVQYMDIFKKIPAYMFILFQAFKVDLRLNDFSSFVKDFEQQGIQSGKTIADVFQMFKLDQLAEGFQAMSSEMPLAQTVLDFFQNQIIADLRLFVVSPTAAFKVQVKLPGVGSFVNKFTGQQ